ncbi:DUF6252 family protein [Aurantibacter sp.]|uniref:DUF6252 family protein n=1 Tax=Aurantibacter sp. TaxID=2807103 RepID=UPI0035C797AC
MKKIFFLALLLITIVGCKEDLTFNTPSFDAVKNNEPWRADGFVAYNNDDGGYSIKGELGVETVIININEAVEGEYILNSGSSASAVYRDATGTVYSTKNDPDDSVTLYPVGGKILLDDVAGSSITGRFQFSAFTANGLQGVTFSGNANNAFDTERYGVFYKVNRFGGSVATTSNSGACQAAVDAALIAETVYDATPDTDANYATVCVTYQSALQLVVDTCSGTILTDAQADLALLTCP